MKLFTLALVSMFAVAATSAVDDIGVESDPTTSQSSEATEETGAEREKDKEPTSVSYFKISEEEAPFIARIDVIAQQLDEAKYQDTRSIEQELAIRFLDVYKKALKKSQVTTKELVLIQAFVQKYQILKERQKVFDNRDPAVRREVCYDKLRLPFAIAAVNYSNIVFISSEENQQARSSITEFCGKFLGHTFFSALTEKNIDNQAVAESDAETVSGERIFSNTDALDDIFMENIPNFALPTQWKIAGATQAVRTVPGLLYESHKPFFRNKKRWSRQLHSLEVARSLNHWGVWKQVASGENPFVLIFEDSVELSKPGLCDIGHAFVKLQKNVKFEWDIAYIDIDMFLADELQDKATLDRLGLDWSVAGFYYGAHAYALTKTGAKKLLDGGLDRCLIPVDEYISYMINPRLHPRREYFKETCEFNMNEKIVALRWRGTNPVASFVNDIDDIEFLNDDLEMQEIELSEFLHANDRNPQDECDDETTM